MFSVSFNVVNVKNVFYIRLETKSCLQFDYSSGKSAGGSAEIWIRLVTVIDSRAVGSKTKRKQIKIVKDIEEISP